MCALEGGEEEVKKGWAVWVVGSWGQRVQSGHGEWVSGSVCWSLLSAFPFSVPRIRSPCQQQLSNEIERPLLSGTDGRRNCWGGCGNIPEQLCPAEPNGLVTIIVDASPELHVT